MLAAWDVPPPVAAPKRARRPLKELDATFNDYQRRRAAELTPADVERAARRRQQVRVDGLATETYQRITLEDALRRLTPGPEGA